jgi:hypothetical protein
MVKETTDWHDNGFIFITNVTVIFEQDRFMLECTVQRTASLLFREIETWWTSS